mmetsp:Transcript_57599/g.163551  ORF Transcript_57599/g.163551 Transcript_57599/m.163551 type:complete len:206 (+) Transcript_57599:390-1007(+)
MSSPASSLRNALQSLMLTWSVSAMPARHLYAVLPASAHSWPCLVLIVNQPVAPSASAFARARMEQPPPSSIRGPSSTSMTSPAFRERTTLLPSLGNSSCRVTAWVANMQGFGVSCMKGVPWLPLLVTQPSSPSTSARTRTRARCRLSSTLGPSSTSTTSPNANNRTVVPPKMLKSGVTATSFTHLLYRSSSAKRLRRFRPPASPS